MDLLKQLNTQLSPQLFNCAWRNEISYCNELAETVTEDGICYTFNNLDQSDIFREENLHTDYRYTEQRRPSATEWSLDTGYLGNATWASHPERTPTSGILAGLRISLPFNLFDIDILCKSNSQGAKIVFHAPGDIPNLSKQYFRISPNQEMIMSVKPNMMITSEQLHAYDPKRRQCYFQDERPLHFFRRYTQVNCELECLTNYTVQQCGCVKFAMPRNKSTRICGLKSMECYKKAAIELFNPYEGDLYFLNNCDCIPACTSLSYEVESSQGHYDTQKLLEALEISPTDDEYKG